MATDRLGIFSVAAAISARMSSVSTVPPLPAVVLPLGTQSHGQPPGTPVAISWAMVASSLHTQSYQEPVEPSLSSCGA